MKTLDLTHRDSETGIALSEVTKLISKSRKICVLTGAGISCNAGIPDFRSSDGLYNMVKEKHPKAVVKGKDLFDISLFRDETTLKVFCTFMESLYTSTISAKPTETHKFIKTLKNKKKLLRCYTQNIDSLERDLSLNTGINQLDSNLSFQNNWKNLDVVQLHGDLRKLSCTNCFTTFDWNDEYQNLLSDGENPECPVCIEQFQQRIDLGKRLTGNIGMLRPNIVLYGENHPQAESLAKGLNIDMRARPDLLLIFGTSLKVDGIRKLVRTLSKSIHDKNGKIILINKTPLSSATWDNVIDYQILSDCDNYVSYLKSSLPDLFLSQHELDLKKLSAPLGKSKASKLNKKCLLTPPATPAKNRIIDYETRSSMKKCNVVHELDSDVVEIPSPEYSPIIKKKNTPLKLISNSTIDNMNSISGTPGTRTRLKNMREISESVEEIESPEFSPIRKTRSPLAQISKSKLNSRNNNFVLNGKNLLNSPVKKRIINEIEDDDCIITGERKKGRLYL